MKSQTNLTIAKLRKFLLVTALVIIPFLALQSGNAQTATATLTSGGLTSITINQNGSFTLTLAVTTNFTSSGYSNWYSISANGVGLFTIASPRVNLSPIHPVTGEAVFNDPTSTNFNIFNGSNGVLNQGPNTNSNLLDLGYTGDQVHDQGAGLFSLQSITISALNAGPGVYTLFLDPRSIMVNHNGASFSPVSMGGALGPQFTITVIPEPTTVGLVILGGAALLVAVRRRIRA